MELCINYYPLDGGGGGEETDRGVEVRLGFAI